MKIAILTTDNREDFRRYGDTAPCFGLAVESLLEGFSQLPETEVHVVSCAQQPMKSPEKLASNVWFHGLHVPKLGWLRTAYQGCIRAVRAKLRELRPDIVHGQGTERDCAMSAVFSGFPNVLTIHGNMRLVAQVNRAKFFSAPWLAARLEGFILPRTNGVVCITHYTQRAVASLARRTWVVPNATEQAFFDINAPLNGSRTILCVGLISHRKNQNSFIRALDPIATTAGIKVVFAGGLVEDCEYCAEFLQLVAARPWCEFPGFISRDQLKVRLRESAVLALPSFEDNCPLVVLEAMAAGVPVLAANVGGVPDLVADGKTGVLCDPTNAESMRSGVMRLLNEPDLARRVASAAQAQARERYLPGIIARRHLEIYGEVLDRRPAR